MTVLGSVTLTRRTYEVSRDGTEFVVRSEGSRGQVNEARIPGHLVDVVGQALRGRRVTKDEAGRVARRLGDPEDVPASGHTLDYYGQNILVILVTLDRAAAEQVDRPGSTKCLGDTSDLLDVTRRS